MTAQIGERLRYKGKVYEMATEPLEAYLQTRHDIAFIMHSTACWRGYYGKWKISYGKLYLIGLKAYLEGYEEVGLDYLFPNQKEVFANWFTGEIRIPQGALLEYIHIGYASIYERNLFLVFKDGILLDQYEE